MPLASAFFPTSLVICFLHLYAHLCRGRWWSAKKHCPDPTFHINFQVRQRFMWWFLCLKDTYLTPSVFLTFSVSLCCPRRKKHHTLPVVGILTILWLLSLRAQPRTHVWRIYMTRCVPNLFHLALRYKMNKTADRQRGTFFYSSSSCLPCPFHPGTKSEDFGFSMKSGSSCMFGVKVMLTLVSHAN